MCFGLCSYIACAEDWIQMANVINYGNRCRGVRRTTADQKHTWKELGKYDECCAALSLNRSRSNRITLSDLQQLRSIIPERFYTTILSKFCYHSACKSFWICSPPLQDPWKNFWIDYLSHSKFNMDFFTCTCSAWETSICMRLGYRPSILPLGMAEYYFGLVIDLAKYQRSQWPRLPLITIVW